MFVRLLKEDLKSWAYDASLAGLRYSLEMTTRGLQLSVGGYSSTVRDNTQIENERFHPFWLLFSGLAGLVI